MEIFNIEYDKVKCEKITPWWKFWAKYFWVTTEKFRFAIATDEFYHEVTAQAGIVFDKRSGPFIVGILYPKWGVKNFTARFRDSYKRVFKRVPKKKYNWDLYNALILWHDLSYHELENGLPYAIIAEVFDKVSEEVGFSDLRSDLGEFFTKHFGRDSFGADDTQSIRNKKLIWCKTEWL